MSIRPYLKNLRSALTSGRRHASGRSSRRALSLESLEDRRMLAFAPITALPVDPYPVEVAAGDFNNDGQVDLVAANDSGGVSVLLGNGDGAFQAGTTSLVGPSPGSLALGDFNADGNLDLAAATYDDAGTSDNDVGILLGNGDGTFADGQSYPGQI